MMINKRQCELPKERSIFSFLVNTVSGCNQGKIENTKTMLSGMKYLIVHAMIISMLNYS